MKNRLILTFVLSFFLLTGCTTKITEDSIDNIDLGMPTERALNVLGNGKKITDKDKILEILNTENKFIEKQLDKFKDNDAMLKTYQQKSIDINTAIEMSKKGYKLEMYKYKVDVKEANVVFYLITAQEKDDDIVVAEIFEEK